MNPIARDNIDLNLHTKLAQGNLRKALSCAADSDRHSSLLQDLVHAIAICEHIIDGLSYVQEPSKLESQFTVTNF